MVIVKEIGGNDKVKRGAAKIEMRGRLVGNWKLLVEGEATVVRTDKSVLTTVAFFLFLGGRQVLPPLSGPAPAGPPPLFRRLMGAA